jgi:hypothetical protein
MKGASGSNQLWLMPDHGAQLRCKDQLGPNSNIYPVDIPVGGNWRTWKKSTTFGRAFTDSFHIKVMSPQRKSNPWSQRWKALALTIVSHEHRCNSIPTNPCAFPHGKFLKKVSEKNDMPYSPVLFQWRFSSQSFNTFRSRVHTARICTSNKTTSQWYLSAHTGLRLN